MPQKIGIEDIARLMMSLPPQPDNFSQLVLTVRQAARLREFAAEQFRDGAKPEFALYAPKLWSTDFIVEQPISDRIRTGRIIQRDRFAEYAAADMVWAEPLGLAEWETVDREQVIFGIKETLMERFEKMVVGEVN